MKEGLPFRAFLFLLLSVALSGCLHDPGSSSSEESVQIQDHLAAVENMPASNNRFALDMYHELAKEPGNVFFSPWSLTSALAMTAEGARGNTAEEIASILHFTGNDTVRRQSFSALNQRFNARASGYSLSSANALWVDADFPVRGEYVGLVNNYYHAKASNLDFKGAGEQSRRAINTWVEENTNGMITDLIDPGSINFLTRLVLSNAVYFNGNWTVAFDRSLTRDEHFFKADGRVVRIPMMRQTGGDAVFGYLETEEMQMLRMQYTGGNISMILILPRGNATDALESLSAEEIEQWRGALQERRVYIFIPRFKIKTDYPLNDALTNLGMPTAFSEMSDFSGIVVGRELFISEVRHGAYVDVNELGTEVAAATEVCVAESANPNEPEPPVFRADRSFIFLIEDRETGCILFLGRFSDPAEG